jgi:hypothetical protein
VRFYGQVYGLPPTDRPADTVINNDDALDKWYEAWQRQMAAEASKLKAQNASAPVAADHLRNFKG